MRMISQRIALVLFVSGVLVSCGCAPSVDEKLDRLYAGEREGSLKIGDLEAVLADESPKLRSSAAALLGDLDDPRAVPLLAAAAKDANAGVRASAAISLGRLARREGESVLITLTHDDSPVVRLKAVRALAKVGGEAAVPALLEVLETEVDADLRVAVVQVLSEIASPASFDAFVALLNDDAVLVRAWAARGLSVLGDFRALPALEALLASKNRYDRGAAEQAIAQIRAHGEKIAPKDGLKKESPRGRSPRAAD